MKRSELYRAVAAVTGESVGEIRRRGFQLLDPDEGSFAPELACPAPSAIDWDEVESRRTAAFPSRRRELAGSPAAA